MCLYPDLAFIWIFHQGYVHQIKNGDILQLGGQCAIGPDKVEGEYAGEKLRKEVNFFYPINSIKLGREWREREKAEGGTNQVSFGCLVG